MDGNLDKLVSLIALAPEELIEILRKINWIWLLMHDDLSLTRWRAIEHMTINTVTYLHVGIMGNNKGSISNAIREILQEESMQEECQGLMCHCTQEDV